MNTISKKFGGEVGSLEGRKFRYTGDKWFVKNSEITLEEDDDSDMPKFSGIDTRYFTIELWAEIEYVEIIN